jgi:hypothetical protein
MHRYSTKQNGNVSIVTIDCVGTFEQDFLCTADRHWDNPQSDRELQQKHLDEAMDRKAGVFDFGDLFCAMQGKEDRRATKSSLRVEHKQSDYYDILVESAAEWFYPYRNRLIRLAYGNHETSVLNKHETDLTKRLVDTLNRGRQNKTHLGGYSGWILFEFRGADGKIFDRKKLWYIHGYGGGGPVTRGVIQSNRQAVYVPDADIVINGHIHEEWTLPITRTRLNDDGQIWRDEQLHVRIPTYKDEYADGRGGWHIETGKPPKPIGAIWLTFRRRTPSSHVELIVTRAK